MEAQAAFISSERATEAAMRPQISFSIFSACTILCPRFRPDDPGRRNPRSPQCRGKRKLLSPLPQLAANHVPHRRAVIDEENIELHAAIKCLSSAKPMGAVMQPFCPQEEVHSAPGRWRMHLPFSDRENVPEIPRLFPRQFRPEKAGGPRA